MKTLQIIGAPHAGGAETFYVRFVEALAEAAEVVPLVRAGSWVAEQLVARGIRPFEAPFRRWADFSTRRTINHLIASEQPDIVQVWMNRAASFAPARCGRPVVGRLGGYYALKNYRNCDALVGNTEDIRDYLVKSGWPAERAFYVPNFAPEPSAGCRVGREALRRQWDIADDDFVGFIAGRLHTNKGIDVALKALSRLPRQHRLLVAGEGPDEALLKGLAEELGVADRVRWLGWVNDISRPASAADVWLVPSRHEPLGNVVLDAWMHRMPVIAARSAGPLSLIADGQDGLLVGLEDDVALAAAISRIATEDGLAARLASRGFEAVDSRFSKRVVINKWLDFYRSLAGAAATCTDAEGPVCAD